MGAKDINTIRIGLKFNFLVFTLSGQGLGGSTVQQGDWKATFPDQKNLTCTLPSLSSAKYTMKYIILL